MITTSPAGAPPSAPMPTFWPRPCLPAASLICSPPIFFAARSMSCCADLRDIALDLAELSSTDRTGVALVVALEHTLSTHAGRLTIINASPCICAALTDDQPPLRPLLNSPGC